MPLNDQQIDAVRRIVRLEALRSSVLSVASESLDEHTPFMLVEVSLNTLELEAKISFRGRSGEIVSGGDL